MRLYMAPGACSLAPHIVLREAELPFELIDIDRTVDPNGHVPALQLDDGRMLTEGGAIVLYLADQKPTANLAPPPGSVHRYVLVEWLNFITTELHGLCPLCARNELVASRESTIERIAGRLAYIEHRFTSRQYLLGDVFTVADALLFTSLSWTPYAKIDLARWPLLAKYRDQVAERPAVKEALRVEAEMRVISHERSQVDND